MLVVEMTAVHPSWRFDEKQAQPKHGSEGGARRQMRRVLSAIDDFDKRQVALHALVSSGG